MDEEPATLAQILEDEGLDPAHLREILEPIHPVDLAEAVGDLAPGDQARVLETLEPERAAAVLEAIPPEMRASIVDLAGEDRLMGVIDAMSPQAISEIIDHLPAHKERAMISQLDGEQREDVEDHRQYAPKTAGAKMTRNYVVVPEHFTAGEAIRAIQGAVTTDTVTNLYVVDDNDHMVGVCGLGSLMTHSPETPLSEFMRREVHFVGVNVDQEEVARMARKYRLKAVPVVDNQMHLVGVVTLRDLLEVVHEEANEDVMHVAGAASIHPVHSGVLTRVRGRLPWLGVAMAFQLALSWVMMAFHETLSIVALTFFIPVIMAMGGNVGLQSSTTVVRGIATGDIGAGRMMRVVAMESRAGVLIAILCGVVTGLTAWLMHLSQPTAIRLAVIVTVSMIASIAFAGVIGSAIPFILHRMKRDPAVASGPFITSLLDIVNVTIYLSLAAVLLAKTIPPK